MRSKNSLLRLHRFRFEEKRRQVSEIEFMIADFQRKFEDIDLQIKAEEERTGISDPSHFNYSMTAKSLVTRRENLVKSMDELKEQLVIAKAEAEETEADLRKVELLAEKEGLIQPAVPEVPGHDAGDYIGS